MPNTRRYENRHVFNLLSGETPSVLQSSESISETYRCIGTVPEVSRVGHVRGND